MAQKVISKAEGRIVALATVTPSAEAVELAAVCDKDPRLVELILSEAAAVVRAAPGLLIVKHRLGFNLANAGIDASNVDQADHVILLPDAPDTSARLLSDNIRELSGRRVGVIVSDSWGRPWRLGTVGFAIGVAGLPALLDMRGEADLAGRTLETTTIAVADELAAAASLLMGQAAEGNPVIVVRGLKLSSDPGSADELIRPREEDAFQ